MRQQQRNNKALRTMPLRYDTLDENFSSACRSRIVIRTKIKTNHWIISPLQSIFLFIHTKFFGGFRAIQAVLRRRLSWSFCYSIPLFCLCHCWLFRIVSAFHYLCRTTQCKYWPNELRQIDIYYKIDSGSLSMNLIELNWAVLSWINEYNDPFKNTHGIVCG